MTASFEQWVRASFDHDPTGQGEQDWYWRQEFDDFWDSLGMTDEVTVRYLIRLFGHPEPLNAYSLDQVARGIWFLVGESSPAQPSRALVYSNVALEARVAGIRSIADFFGRFVVPAAPGPARENDDAFHTACYMWWDIFPTWGGTVAQPDVIQRELNQSAQPSIHNACLQTMADVLELPTELCQLSALHGLNHWHLNHASRVEQIIDAYLTTSTTATPRMRDYAASARLGCCQ